MERKEPDGGSFYILQSFLDKKKWQFIHARKENMVREVLVDSVPPVSAKACACLPCSVEGAAGHVNATRSAKNTAF